MCELYTYREEAQAIVKKWAKASAGYMETQVALQELTARLDAKWIAQWQAAETIAIEERGEYLRVYDVQIENGECFQWLKYHMTNCSFFLAPTCAEVRLQLAEHEAKQGRSPGIVVLLAQGLSIEEAQ
jgi:hypothetical protein